MGLFNGSILKAIRTNIIPVAAGLIGGTAIGRAIGVGQQQPSAQAATAVAETAPATSSVQTSAEGGTPFMQSKILGMPAPLALGLGVVILGVGGFLLLRKAG